MNQAVSVSSSHQDPHVITSMPLVVLMPHSRCNCRCVMCDIWKANKNLRQLSREDLEGHIDHFRELGVRWVVLSGGEALMNKNLWTLCDLLDEVKVGKTLLSTGLLLKAHAEQIVRRINVVTVSLDGSREVHDSIRRIPRAFDKMAEGIAALKWLNPNIRVTGRCVLQRSNYRDLPNIIDSAKTIGLNQISFLTADVTSEAFNRPDPWAEERVDEVALNPQQVEEFSDLVEEVIESHSLDFETKFIAERPNWLRRFPQYYAAQNGDAEFPETFCNSPWKSAVIEADGSVRPCFFHPAFGNIRDKPIGEILNSEEAIAFRRNLDVKTDDVCRKCVCTFTIQD